MNKPHPLAPVYAYQLRAPSLFELSRGAPVACAPSTLRHAEAVQAGALVVGTDPDAVHPMLYAGYTPDPTILRAPDISVGRFVGGSGWIQGAPELAIRYVEPDQDREDLARFVFELLTAGTRWVWVVWLGGPARVDVHSFAVLKRSYASGERIPAPGVLRNPVLTDALYLRELALAAAAVNLAQTRGFSDLEALHEEGCKLGERRGKRAGRREGLREAIQLAAQARGWTLSEAQREALRWCDDREKLESWLAELVQAAEPAALRFA